ncbi:MAG: hypothetical protein IPH26_12440 [Sterolibacteriaceae bacterium]|uniref:Uncharacterized protein n=1 Tax=Candidatus Methylophosphatis roskildensis TaxID=2899263 RepID=A0A9D7HM37_9PROT|nr:hypothetical protein [Candidatus Methylophosphatis roskildensis]MBK7236088.1 hypothetical protein [Sterolibacteriaceae bacterium]
MAQPGYSGADGANLVTPLAGERLEGIHDLIDTHSCGQRSRIRGVARSGAAFAGIAG